MEHLKSCYVLETGNKVLLCSNISSFIFFVTVSSYKLKDLSHLDKNIFVLTHKYSYSTKESNSITKVCFICLF